MHLTPEITKLAIRLELLAARDVGRGSSELQRAVEGDLLQSALTLSEARPLRLVVLTGFYIPSANPPAAETDGPIGAAILCKLVEALGGHATIVTDSKCLDVVAAVANEAKIKGRVTAVDAPLSTSGSSVPVANQARDLFQSSTHALSIERVGPGEDGQYRNMRGEIITQHTAPLDQYFERSGLRTIAIGDGGNEIGMGKIPRSVVASHVPLGSDIQCVTTAHHLIVGGTSNWGAQALCALTSLLAPGRISANTRQRLLDRRFHIRLLAAAHDAGAVDGATKAHALTVDGLDRDTYISVIDEIERMTCG